MVLFYSQTLLVMDMDFMLLAHECFAFRSRMNQTKFVKPTE